MSTAKAAALAAILRQPNSVMTYALRQLSVDDVWALFEAGDPRLPEAARARFANFDLDGLLRTTETCAARIVTPGDAEWPRGLDDLGPSAPWALWLRGRVLATRSAVAVVGSRSCTSYGERVAADLANGLGDAGQTVVSGGAFGIDAAAHRGALVAGAHTVAVLGSGVDVAYPASHAALFDRIAIDGTLVSESPPGAHPTRAAFLVRNRLIAAMSQGTVVVEARFRSGALSTARHAAELNRMVMGIPGPMNSPESAGVHDLIKHGAQLVTSAADIVSLVSPLGSVQGELPMESDSEWDQLTAPERQVYEAFPARQPIRIEAIRLALDSDLATPSLLAALTSLKRRGLVAEANDGSWRRLRAPNGAVA